MAHPSTLIKAGQKIFVAGSSNEPTALIQHLLAEGLPADLHFVQFPIAGFNNVDFTQVNDSAHLTTFFMTPALKNAAPERLHFLPMQMRWVYSYLSQGIDVALVQVAKDREGNLRLGPNVDFAEAVLGTAKVVLAELNADFVAPAGAPLIDPARLDYVFESERKLFAPAAPVVDDTALQIGAHVAGLIKDGDVLQTGIGAIPAAILSQLGDKNDLGMHGGLIDDGGMQLIRNGNLNGRTKTRDTHQHITGMALGSQALLNWLAQTPEVVFRGANHTHDACVIAQLDNFVSVNSAVEIDLLGQVNAEYAGGRQISGTGGSVDFMRAAKAARGGRSIIAMNATARGGSISRIVPRVELVTALRTDVDIVVTEFGVAQLKNLPVEARVEALIDIAAPQFRDALRQGEYDNV
ncbi:MAG: acetyl-CoA hydrolase/transferase family protein [bacterium]